MLDRWARIRNRTTKQNFRHQLIGLKIFWCKLSLKKNIPNHKAWDEKMIRCFSTILLCGRAIGPIWLGGNHCLEF